MSDRNGMTVAEWHQMTATGRGTLLRELLDGEVVVKAPTSEAHADCVVRLHGLIERIFGDRALVQMNLPVVLDDRSEPRPDISVLEAPGESGPDGRSRLLLVIEIADTNQELVYGRGRKAAYYARSQVPDCWIVDLLGRQVLAHSAPASSGYRDIRNVRENSELVIAALPNVSIPAGDVLGPAPSAPTG